MTIPSLRLFGTPALLNAAQQPVAGAAVQPRRLAVLAVLADAWPAPVSRDDLVQRIWPDQDAAAGRRLLTQAISVLRRELGEIVSATAAEVLLEPSQLRVDLLAFREAAALGDDVRMMALHRGPFLDELSLRGAEEFDAWAAERRTACAALAAEAATRVSADTNLGVTLTPDPAADPVPDTPSAEVVEQIAPVTAPRAVRRWRLPAALAVAGVAALVLVLRNGAPLPLTATSAGDVQVRPFESRGDAGATAAASGVGDVLARSLDGIAGVRLHADAAAGRTGVVEGTLTMTGSEVRIDAVLRRAGGGEFRTSAVGPSDRVLATIERLAVRLAPALLPEDVRPVPTGVLEDVPLAAVRRLLAGELATRDNDPEAAYAEFRAATEADTTFSWGWYRRARAAEFTTRTADADSAIGRASSTRAGLPARQRMLIEAYALWRGGDALGAERQYRELVTEDWRDAEAWNELGEIAYHAGPLHGRPIDLARDAWSRVRSLDSMSLSASTHALRLAARVRDTATVRAMLARLDKAPARSVSEQESRVLAALTIGTATERRAAEQLLDTLPDYSLFFLHAVTAGLLERPADAQRIAERLTRASQPTAVQAQAQIALAHLAIAGGRWNDAMAALDRAAALAPLPAAWARAQFAALVFLPTPPGAARAALQSLSMAPEASSAPPLSLEFVVEAPAVPLISAYLTQLLLQAEGRDGARAVGDAAALPCPAPSVATLQLLCADLRLGLLADAAWRAGDRNRAAAQLDAMSGVVPYQLSGRSAFFARSRERWLRAEVLAAAGRAEEADGWFGAMSQGARLDYIYLAPSHLRRGQLREQQGDTARAAGHYRRVLELWADADAVFQPLRREAEEGLKRVTHAR